MEISLGIAKERAPAASAGATIGAAAQVVVDWTTERPGGAGCPRCGKNLQSDGHCPWCGHPDPEAARKRIQERMANDPDREQNPLRRAAMKCLVFLKEERDGAVETACPKDADGQPDRARMDSGMRPLIEEMEKLIAEIEAAL